MYTAKEAVEVYVAGSEKRAKNSALKIFVLAIFLGIEFLAYQDLRVCTLPQDTYDRMCFFHFLEFPS